MAGKMLCAVVTIGAAATSAVHHLGRRIDVLQRTAAQGCAGAHCPTLVSESVISERLAMMLKPCTWVRIAVNSWP